MGMPGAPMEFPTGSIKVVFPCGMFEAEPLCRTSSTDECLFVGRLSSADHMWWWCGVPTLTHNSWNHDSMVCSSLDDGLHKLAVILKIWLGMEIPLSQDLLCSITCW